MRITVYLLDEELQASGELLRRQDMYVSVPLEEPDGSEVEWELHLLQNSPQPVRWLSALTQIMRDRSTFTLYNQSAGAVLFVRAHGRAFAITFGQGFHDIRPSQVVPDFGLRVAANSVDPLKVTTGEARGLGKGARNAVSSLPVPNGMFALRLSTMEEWIRRIGGQALEKDFALSVSGADSLRLSKQDFSLRSLPGTLAEVLKRYHATTYLQNFPFLDYFRRIPSGSPLVAELDATVAQQMVNRQEDVGFAAPDEFNFSNVDEYVLKGARGRRHTIGDLTSEAVYKAIDELDAWHDPLHAVTVSAKSGDEFVGPVRELRQYLVSGARRASASAGAREYALTAGTWFSIASDYAEYVNQVMTTIPEEKLLALPDWDDEWLRQNVEGKYGEQRYNRHASEPSDRALLDRKLYYDAKAGQRVEACDIITANKELICVKRLDGSDTMVQLFEQGSVSAALMRDLPYRKFVMNGLAQAGRTDEFGTPSDWTFVFAIATSRPGNIKGLLPFFAKSSLVANVQAITDRGFKVSLLKVERR